MVALCSTSRILVVAHFLTGCAADISMNYDRQGDRLVRRVPRERQKSEVAHTVFAQIQPQGLVQSPDPVEHNGDGGLEGSAPTQVMAPSGLAEVNGAGEVRFKATNAASKDMSTKVAATTPTAPQPSQISERDHLMRVVDQRIGDVDGQGGVVTQREAITATDSTATTDAPTTAMPTAPGIPTAPPAVTSYDAQTDACRITAISTVASRHFRVEADCIKRVFNDATPFRTEVVHCTQGKAPCETITIRMWPNPGKLDYKPNSVAPPSYHGRALFGSVVWQVGDTISKFPPVCSITAISTTWAVAGRYFRVEADCIKRVFNATGDKIEVLHCTQGETTCETIKIKMWPNPGKLYTYKPNGATPAHYHGRSALGSKVWKVGDTISKEEEEDAEIGWKERLKRKMKTVKNVKNAAEKVKGVTEKLG